MENKKLDIYFTALIKVMTTAVVIFTVSCKQTSKNIPHHKETQAPAAIRKKPASSFGDTISITGKCVVFYKPDSLQLEKIKAVNEKMIFESLTHDCFYQMRNARQVLKKYWPAIKVIEVSKFRWLLFVKKDKTKVYTDLDSKNDICGMIMFNEKDEPLPADMMNIETALNFYFKN